MFILTNPPIAITICILNSSMYVDEDGDLAHEFYEEVKADDSLKTRMERRIHNLKPQV